jgi:hypothetical protein
MVEAAEKTPKPWRTGADLVDASATWSIGPGILYISTRWAIKNPICVDQISESQTSELSGTVAVQ